MNYIYKRIKNFLDNSYLSIKRNECCNLIIYIAFPIYFKKSLALYFIKSRSVNIRCKRTKIMILYRMNMVDRDKRTKHMDIQHYKFITNSNVCSA